MTKSGMVIRGRRACFYGVNHAVHHKTPVPMPIWYDTQQPRLIKKFDFFSLLDTILAYDIQPSFDSKDRGMHLCVAQ